ncbi:MAG TPA: hypothetical protein VI358_18860 [Pseudolabrys sp.]
MKECSLIAEIEGTFATGSVEKQAEIVRRVTDLFLAGADSYSDKYPATAQEIHTQDTAAPRLNGTSWHRSQIEKIDGAVYAARRFA